MAWTAKNNEEIDAYIEQSNITIKRDKKLLYCRPRNVVEAEKRRLNLLDRLEEIIRCSKKMIDQHLIRSQFSAMRYIYDEDEKGRTEAIRFDELIKSDDRLIGICKELIDIANKKHNSKKGK
jgi:hypothetical protein